MLLKEASCAGSRGCAMATSFPPPLLGEASVPRADCERDASFLGSLRDLEASEHRGQNELDVASRW